MVPKCPKCMEIHSPTVSCDDGLLDEPMRVTRAALEVEKTKGVEFRGGDGVVYRVLDTPVLPTGSAQQYRIEALRAASRVVSMSLAPNVVAADVPTLTIDLAEQFACWLEDGKR